MQGITLKRTVITIIINYAFGNHIFHSAEMHFVAIVIDFISGTGKMGLNNESCEAFVKCDSYNRVQSARIKS